MFNIIGATETIPLANLMTTPEEFPWFAFDDETAGIEWRNANIPGREVYEMVIVRKKDWSKQGAFYAFPEKNEFSTNDLFERHPTKPDLWRTIGVFILSTRNYDFRTNVEAQAEPTTSS